MQALRNASFLARLVLAWFALAIGVAVASPLVNPQGVELICSGGGGMKLLVNGGDEGGAAAGHAMDCPLCGSFGAAPPPSHGWVPTESGAGPVPSLAPAARPALSAAPPPARGPPAFSALS